MQERYEGLKVETMYDIYKEMQPYGSSFTPEQIFAIVDAVKYRLSEYNVDQKNRTQFIYRVLLHLKDSVG